jgi:hypothetical protein
MGMRILWLSFRRCRPALGSQNDCLIVNRNSLSFGMTVGGSVCWGICFWWMRRLSLKQNFLLDQLREQGKRIEKLSKVEHDLIKEVHPQVNEIKEGMDEMRAAVRENAKNPPA